MALALFFINWPNVFLVCFIVGFVLALLSVLSGLLELHLPGNLGHVFHVHMHTHVPHVPHGHVHIDGSHVHAGVAHGAGEISPINFPTIMAFLAWFGGTGYLLTSVYGFWYLTALGLATIAGLIGASIVFWFFVKVMLASERPMDPTEFRVVGAVGTLTLGIREGGTGELVYVQGGSRKTVAARTEDGSAIPKGTEVAVTSFERGVAFVRPWDELADDATIAGTKKQ